MSTPTHSLSATIARIYELDRLYLEADRLYALWWTLTQETCGLPDSDPRAQERILCRLDWRNAKRRYEALRDSEEGMP